MNEGESLMTVRNQSALPLFISFQDKITCPCLSKICPCLFSNEKYRTNNIKDKDLKAYYQLKALVSLEYNQFDSSHEESLKSLYLKTINNNFTNNLTSAEWEKIGFNVMLSLCIFLIELESSRGLQGRRILRLIVYYTFCFSKRNRVR